MVDDVRPLACHTPRTRAQSIDDATTPFKTLGERDCYPVCENDSLNKSSAPGMPR